MNEIQVKNLRFETSRGLSPAGKRYEYNTIMVFEVENDELAMGIKPIEYIKLKRMLGEELDSLEKVMESSVKEIGKSKSFFAYFCNKFVQPKLEIIFSEIDKVIIDTLNVHYPPIGYDLLATVYLINKHEISNFGCGEAAVMAKIANKKIYIIEDIFKAKDDFLKRKKEYQEKTIKEREKKRDAKRNIYG